MKQIYYLFFSLCLLLGARGLYPQTFTFDKYYPQIDVNVTGYSIDILNDGSYLVGGYSRKKLFIANIDNEGGIKKFRTYDTQHNFRHKSIQLMSDGNIAAISTTIASDGKKKIFLLKLNSKLDTIWTKIFNNFPSSDENEGLRVFNLSNGDYLIFGTSVPIYLKRKIVVIRIDAAGEIQFTKLFDIMSMNENQGYYKIEKMSVGNFGIAGKSKLIIINSDGNELLNKDFNKIIVDIAPASDSKLLIAVENVIHKIDIYGNTISEISLKNTDLHFGLIYELSDKHIFTAYSGNMFEIDSSGNVLWQSAINGAPYSLSSSSDKGFIITGYQSGHTENEKYLWLLKSDSLGFYKSLQILYPFNGMQLFPNPCKTIKWFSSGIDELRISFSSNDGVVWYDINSNISAGNGNSSIEWHTPYFNENKVYIKITGVDDPAFADSIYFYFGNNTANISGYNYIAVNQIMMMISNNGDGSYNPFSQSGGFLWPGGYCAKISAVYEDGFVYGGLVNDSINVNGSTYRHGWQPGIIINDGSSADLSHPSSAIWKIKKDWESIPQGFERDVYSYNYENWPGEFGAPYTDVDGDGKFTKGIDKPKFIGDEVLYFVSNDLDSEKTAFVYGSPPIGLEFHVTVWAYDTDNFLQDVVFKKYQIINKGNKIINDMYLSYWADDDLGDTNDDFVGCDTTLNLGYTYNGDNNDDRFYGINPPALGRALLQGPIVKAESKDSAKFAWHWKKGYKNLPMTSFVLYIGGSSAYSDPYLGNTQGADMFYNNMKGLRWDGENYLNPNTGEPVRFSLSGDPVGGSGWYEGSGWPGGEKPGDRRYVFSSGPFTMAPGDTQEVVYAIFMAQGSDNIQSVAELKNTAIRINKFYDSLILPKEKNNERQIPDKFKLYQNYPNPFNPETVIKYSVPSLETQNFASQPNLASQRVSLKIYDILGRVVTTLVNEKQSPGNYEVKFNAENLSSGVYIYRLKINNGFKTMTQTRKMVLLK